MKASTIFAVFAIFVATTTYGQWTTVSPVSITNACWHVAA